MSLFFSWFVLFLRMKYDMYKICKKNKKQQNLIFLFNHKASHPLNRMNVPFLFPLFCPFNPLCPCSFFFFFLMCSVECGLKQRTRRFRKTKFIILTGPGERESLHTERGPHGRGTRKVGSAQQAEPREETHGQDGQAPL